MDLHLFIYNNLVSTKIYDKPDDLYFEIVNFPFLDGDIPHSTSDGVYISQLIQFARASSHINGFNTSNKLSVRNFLNKVIGIINFVKLFLDFIADTMIWYLNSMSDLNLFCARGFQNQSFMTTKCINLGKLSVLIIFQCSLFK